MTLRIGTFTLDNLGLLFSAFGRTLCWLSAAPRALGEPGGAAWRVNRGPA